MTLLQRLKKQYTANEYLVLVYRFVTLLLFYSIFRVSFYLFNADLFPNLTSGRFMTIMLGGVKFDISALLYLNALYLLFYTLPFPIKFSNGYQKFLKWLFMILNGIGFGANAIDFIYYRFILKRTTYNVLNILENEDNMGSLWMQFMADYWYVFVYFIIMMVALAFVYSLLKPRPIAISNRWYYGLASLLALVIFSGFSVVGMRGGYRHSTRPINMSNAGKYVKTPEQISLVLNTPFCIIRTWGKKNYERKNFFSSDQELEKVYSPVRLNEDRTGEMNKKNVVVFILESFNRELFGSFNKDIDGGNYKGYTPFLDSLVNESMVFPNTFANGRKSIDAMPSVIASIPSLVLPYIVSEYSGNKINSTASILGEQGYQTAFFHGAHNGSMGFQAFANMAGFDRYLGKTEYNNDDDFDGIWGIWDDKFFQFYASELNKMKEPFYTTLFSVSSHHPFKVPEEFQGKFPKGTLPLHQCAGYTDYSLKKFFESASKMPWFKNTLFVITADHSSRPHYKEYKTSVNAFAIPLIFYAPGDSLKGVDDKIAQQIDIMPTVLDYLNYKDDYMAFGKDLFDSEEEGYAINYINGSYQFIVDDLVMYFDGKKMMSVFNRIEDPFLEKDIKGTLDISKYEAKCKGIVQQFNNRMLDDRLTIE
ncbi:LTA synthase family protein [Marinilabiliaceae bacterium JC017]|nr:LTA synthase family protein [Marinilabiliaceae bacterium JC017]